MPSHPTLAERLGTIAYRNQTRAEAVPHIKVETAICNSTCPHKCTTRVCPAGCYTFDENKQVQFRFEDCVECGACLYACDQSAVKWALPDPQDGRGIDWSYG